MKKRRFIGFRLEDMPRELVDALKKTTGLSLSLFARQAFYEKLRSLDDKTIKKLKQENEREIKLQEALSKRHKQAYYYNLPTNFFKSVIKICANCLLAHQPIDEIFIKIETDNYKKIIQHLPSEIDIHVERKFYLILKDVSNLKWLRAYFYDATNQQLKFASQNGFIPNRQSEQVEHALGLIIAEEDKKDVNPKNNT